ncbi:GumC family protein [Aliiglaciecola lipolytica]|uniref:Polysaccharide chain length determinant N-terminal domain-containing protein n=1 Tax=Aliiglaciecola lipolytica E3 TaxID=1127673 RepID=K6YAL4_9ALTE|nr:hypothetical protein [Aliiglaciecola lipolytica]GAC13708.1 hypothetical protein GLIP_1066 [Aliiglaciecola lipolytica E3]
MTKRDIFIFLFKWHRRIIGMFVFIVAVAILMQYISPQPFSAKAVVLVEHNRAPMMRADISPGLQTVDVLNTQVDIILSHTVIANAVDMVKPHERPEKPGFIKDMKKSFRSALVSVGLSDEATKRDNWIRYLLKNVSVKALVSSSIIHIKYTDENPDWSSDMVNAIVQSYIKHHVELYNSSGTAEVYKRQMDQLLSQLVEHRKALDKYNQSEDVAATSELRKSLIQRQSALQERIAVREHELGDLLLRFSAEHEKVIALKGQIEANRQEISGIQEQMQNLEENLSETTQMRLNIETEEALYRSYKRRYDEERLKELANADLINVRVVELSTPAVRPDHSRLFYIAIAVIGAFIFSFGIAFIFEYFDRRVSSSGIAEEILDVPELGSIDKF